MGPEIVVPLGAFVCAIILAIGVPLARAFSRRMDAESRNPRLPKEGAPLKAGRSHQAAPPRGTAARKCR